MLREYEVNMLKRGDVFRDWLVDLLRDRIHNKDCLVKVYKIAPASHTICRYEFKDENYSVIAKFYAEPTGWKKNYDAEESMKREFKNLKIVEKFVDVPKPLAIKRKFGCVLITEYIDATPLYKYMKNEIGLFDRLTAVAALLRKLHDSTRSHYHKDGDFYKFHQTIDQLNLNREHNQILNQLLGKWWDSNLLDSSNGCMIHHDANPVNYIFRGDKVYALDFESARLHANPVHDLGIMAAELKHYFALHKKDGSKAEPYIGHFLWQYSKNLAEFQRITRILPFFMSLGLLRMDRLKIDPDHGNFIFRESMACLRSIEHQD
jgi:tRNA A-37 threonylcarbamoyl transferase component Bud32